MAPIWCSFTASRVYSQVMYPNHTAGGVINYVKCLYTWLELWLGLVMVLMLGLGFGLIIVLLLRLGLHSWPTMCIAK